MEENGKMAVFMRLTEHGILFVCTTLERIHHRHCNEGFEVLGNLYAIMDDKHGVNRVT